MRARCGALIAAALLAACASPAAAAPAPRAALLFLPSAHPLAAMAAHPELSLGLVSPTLGGYKRGQFAIDISQGARISTRAYTRRLPPLRLTVRDSRWAGWSDLVRRARDAPGDVVPGLLASTISRAGGSVSYVGVSGAEDSEALAAADERGVIGQVSAGPAVGFGARAARAWRSSSLLVSRLPGGAAGTAALAQLLRARRPGDLVAVVEAPPARGLRLLAAGMVGPGLRGGELYSGTTRRTGLVAAPDLSATILRALGLRVPNKMQGETISSRVGSAADVRSLEARLNAILPHRDRAVELLAIVFAAVALLLALARGRRGLRVAARLVLLAAIWVPALALLTAALRPSDLAEALIVAFGSLALAALSDLLLPWPAAPLVPAAVSFGAHAIDLALGSHLVGLSLAGPNPKGGSRFFGIGNELEIILALTVLTGAGAALTLAPGGRGARGFATPAEGRSAAPGPRAAGGFAAAAFVGAVVVGAGRLGADVGGVVTFAAGGAAAVVASLPGGPSRRAVALAIVVPVVAVAALVALDYAIGGGAHLTRTLSSSSGPGDLGKVIVRRWRLSVAGLGRGSTPFVFGACLALLAAGIVYRRRLLAGVALERLRPFRAAIVGSFFAVIVGAVANDSGPMIVMIGTVCLALLLGYASSGNPHDAPPGAGLRFQSAHSPGFPLFVHISRGRRKARGGAGE
jgi:hypothetical protein